MTKQLKRRTSGLKPGMQEVTISCNARNTRGERAIFFLKDAPLGVFGIRDVRGKNYRDTGYLRKKLLGYRILKRSFRDTGYSQKIVTYQIFDEKCSWITKYVPFSVFLLMIRYK